MSVNNVKIKVLSLSVLATLVIFANNGCSKKNAETKSANVTNKTLTVDMGAEIPTLDPQLAEDNNSARVDTDLFQGVVKLDQNNVPVPALAKSWTISKDNKTYTFTLRDNLKFSNGSPIKASDVVYSWQRLVNPATGSPYTYIASSILNANKIVNKKLPVTDLGVKAINDNIVQLTLEHPDSDILAKLALAAFDVVSENNIQKYGKEWTLPKNIVTSGAYKLNKHVVNGYLLISKNTYYYNAKVVSINEVKFYPLYDTNISLSKYKAHDLNMTWSTPIDQFKNIKQEYKAQLHVTPMEAVVYYDLNMLRPEFKNPKLRQALNLAVDRVTLTKDVLGTGVIPNYSIITPSIDGGKYSSVVYPWVNEPRSQQIAQAKALYKEAGYGPNNPLELTITYATDDERKKVALAVADMWHNVLGVNVKIQNVDWKIFLQALRKGDYQVAADRWIADYNGVTTYTQMYVCNAPENSVKYCNSEYDKYIKLATYETTPSKRQEYYTKALNIALNDYQIVPLYIPATRRLVSSDIKGYIPETNHLDKPSSEWMSF